MTIQSGLPFDSSGNLVVSGVNASNFVNFNPQNYIHLRAANANMRLGVADLLVLLMGDSTAGGANGVTFVGRKSHATPRYLGQVLTAYGIPASEETGNLGAGAGPSSPNWDARLGANTNWLATGVMPFCQNSQTHTASATWSYTPSRAFDSFDVYWFDFNNSTASATVNVDGGATLATITCGATNTLKKMNVGCTLGTHTINIVYAGSGADFIVSAVVPHTFATRQVNIVGMSYSGGKVGDYVAAAQPINVATWTTFGAALAIIELTINDSNQNTAVSTWQSQTQQIIQAAQAAGTDVILSTGNPINTANGIANIPAYVAAARQLAVANNCGLVEMNISRYVSYAVTNPVMPYADGQLHPGDVQTMDKAEVYAQAMRMALGAGNVWG